MYIILHADSNDLRVFMPNWIPSRATHIEKLVRSPSGGRVLPAFRALQTPPCTALFSHQFQTVLEVRWKRQCGNTVPLLEWHQ